MSKIHTTGHPLDTCRCGDYRHNHEAGTGVCKLCQALNPPWLEKCQQFCLSLQATQAEVDHFKALGIEYPEVL